MKGIGFVLLCITCGLVVFKYDVLSFWSLGLGIALALAFFAFLSVSKEAPPPPDPWEGRFQELEKQTASTAHELSRDIQKLQQKLVRADERCLSYQKLVDVHQGEIDKLKAENRQLGEGLVQKERKINELKWAHLQPDFFEADKRNLEVAYRELKKEFEEKSRLFDQAQSHLIQLEQELRVLPKEQHFHSVNSEQLIQLQEEKKALEAELLSLQQLVSELALPEEEIF